MVCYDKTGKLVFDKLIGKPAALNNPIVSYVKPTTEGKIYMRGHIAKEKKRMATQNICIGKDG